MSAILDFSIISHILYVTPDIIFQNVVGEKLWWIKRHWNVPALGDLQDILPYMASLPHDPVPMRDFNIHIDSLSSNVRQRTCILESFDQDQYVNIPTHVRGHSLDLMVFSKGCDVLSVSTSDMISGHFSVVAGLKMPRDHSRTVPQTITYRKLKTINIEAFKADVKKFWTDQQRWTCVKGKICSLFWKYCWAL